MSKATALISHLTVILGVMFLVFLVLDQFNPMMNFIDNNISRWLLAAFCLSGISLGVLRRTHRPAGSPDRPASFLADHTEPGR